MITSLFLHLLIGVANAVFWVLTPVSAIGTVLVGVPTLIAWITKGIWTLPFLYIFAPSFAIITITEFSIIMYFSGKQIFNMIRGSGA